MKSARVDWDALSGFGVGVLGLDPETFWRLSPRELAAILQMTGHAPRAPLNRAAFEALAAKWPDQTESN